MLATKAKTLSKLIGPVTRFNAMKTNQVMMRNSTIMNSNMLFKMQQMRSFASFDTIEKSGAKLDKALEGEIKYENDNYT